MHIKVAQCDSYSDPHLFSVYKSVMINSILHFDPSTISYLINRKCHLLYQSLFFFSVKKTLNVYISTLISSYEP